MIHIAIPASPEAQMAAVLTMTDLLSATNAAAATGLTATAYRRL